MFKLTRFGDLTLEYPDAAIDNMGSGEMPSGYQVLPGGGALDLFGDRTYPGAVARTKSMSLIGSSEADLYARYLTLLGLAGSRARLYRRLADDSEHWQMARLVRVDAGRSYQDTVFWPPSMPVALAFVTSDRVWHGRDHRSILLDGSHILDGSWTLLAAVPIAAGATTLSLAHGDAGDAGRAPIREVRITVSAGSAVITSLVIARTGGESLTYQPGAAGITSLVIDTGTMQVTNADETEPYDPLTFAPDADMGAWFTLLPGENEITVTIAGGGTGATIMFEYDEAWH